MNQQIKLLFVLTFFIKIVLAIALPLTLDEYYYLVWGQNPQLSYFDHPPMVGWLMIIGNFFKELAPGAIRWPFLFVSHATIYVWYLILKDYLKSQHLFYFLLVALLNPLWGIGNFIATPDIPLLFFWSCSILFCYRLLYNASVMNYIALGMSLGLGFTSKYQIVLFLPCLVFFIYYHSAHRILFSKKTFFSILFGLIFSFPVLIWNYHHEWISFVFQWNHGMSAHQWKWFWPPEYILSQILLIFPIFIAIALRNGERKISLSTLWVFSAFPFFFFFYSSFKGHVEANWPIMAYPSLYALAFIKIKDSDLPWVRRTLTLWFLLFIAALSILFFPKDSRLKKVKLFEASKFDNVLEFAKNNEPVLPFSYQLTSYLSFHLGKDICKFPKYGRIDFYDFKEECKTLPKKFFYIVTVDYVPNVEADFPDYKVVNQSNIDDHYIALEVEQR